MHERYGKWNWVYVRARRWAEQGAWDARPPANAGRLGSYRRLAANDRQQHRSRPCFGSGRKQGRGAFASALGGSRGSLPTQAFAHRVFHVFFMETLPISSKSLKRWWARQGLNLRPHPCEGCALPLSYAPAGRDGSRRQGRALTALWRLWQAPFGLQRHDRYLFSKMCKSAGAPLSSVALSERDRPLGTGRFCAGHSRQYA